MMARILFAMALFLGADVALARVSLDLAKAEERKVDFVATGKPSFMKITGEGEGLSGTLVRDAAGLTGKAVFDLDTLDTGLDLRNHHMKEKYLETSKWKTAELVLKKLPWGRADDGDFDRVDGEFQGDLTLHGVTKPVKGKASVSKTAGALKAEVWFDIATPDFKIDTPEFKGVTVADEIQISVTVSGKAAP